MTSALRRHPGLLALGVLIAASAIPHALLGWPAFADALRAAGVDADLRGGLSAGWHFGSVAMLALGAVVVLAWRDACAGGDFGWRAALVVAAAYAMFGAAALAARGGSPHFLFFLAIGIALAICALRARPAAA